MAENEQEKPLENPFTITSIESIDTPNGCDGKNWYRYVISREGTSIDGLCCGSKQKVTLHVQSVADDLNARSGGRTTSTWAPRQKR